MKNSRLFEILYLLVEKRAVTAGELARRLEVSERTIYRDVDALSAAGIPVFTQKGQGGGIRLMDQFVLDKALLSQEQQDEILFALQATLATGGRPEDGTLSRLTALFRREGGDWLEVDFTDWGSGAAERETFALVKGVILARRPLTFTYYSSAGETSRRTVEPARLVFKGGCWYLSAFCQKRQDWRVFRLMRMEELTVEEGACPPRRPPERLEAPALWFCCSSTSERGVGAGISSPSSSRPLRTQPRSSRADRRASSSLTPLVAQLRSGKTMDISCPGS